MSTTYRGEEDIRYKGFEGYGLCDHAAQGRPPVADGRDRFSCRLDSDLAELLRRELADRAVVNREWVSTPDGKSRLFDAGDIVGAALRLYYKRC